MAVVPVPVLDHVVVNVRDRIDEAADLYRRLGFVLTPRGNHTLGSMNHLAIFGTDYLELIAAKPGDRRRPEILDAPFGLNGIVFSTEDTTGVYTALRATGVDAEPPNAFSRPVDLGVGPARDAVFRTVRLTQSVVPSGRLYFCHQFNRELVWRDEWRRHPNGTVGVIRAVIAAQAPEAVIGYLAGVFGDDAVCGQVMAMGAASLEVMHPDALRAAFGDAAPDGDGRAAFMAALTLRTTRLERAAALPGACAMEGRVVVPASEAFGVTLEFRE
jgi:hypothetical protein